MSRGSPAALRTMRQREIHGAGLCDLSHYFAIGLVTSMPNHLSEIFVKVPSASS